ncbi:endolytic transglycosylase MltG [Methyloligella solikamskensis]|uniref:Endolytic murein transglycosylase n=1 Tax=Methyloligella solikamskensis TaxID=1177756 RepID=A0ABW3JA99_9HYPH
MHPFLRIINRILTLILVAAGIGVGLLYFLKVQFDKPGPLETAKIVVIPQGRGVSAIGEQLESEGVIADRRIFVTTSLYFNYLKDNSTLKAGEYEFAAHTSMRDVLDKLVEGKSIRHKVTVAEGLTSQQVVRKLLDHPELTGEITEIPPEGSLLPDTYLFRRGESRQDILKRMAQAQQVFMAEHWKDRAPDLPIDTPQEALILASIVEKETAVEGERPQIAAVFENRLKKGMRLQSDPTIIYGLVGGEGKLGRPILQSELDKKTVYNTYQIDGLPPTPIANPGRSAILATLNPAETDALYFVADGTGGHAFAASLSEHNDNVADWRRIQRQREKEEAERQAEQDGAASTDNPTGLDGDAEAGLAASAGGDGQPPVPKRNPKLTPSP